MPLTLAQFNYELRKAIKNLINGKLLSKEQIRIISLCTKEALLKAIRLSCDGNTVLGTNIEALLNFISYGTASLNDKVISTKEKIDWQRVDAHINRLFIDLFSGRDIKSIDALAFKGATRYQVIRGSRSYMNFLDGEERKNFLKNISILEMLSLRYSVEVEGKILNPPIHNYEGSKML